MPEFQIPLGTSEAEFNKLPPFVRGYIEAMFFTESGDSEHELNDVNFSDLAPETLQKIISDCEDFQNMPKDGQGRTALDLAYDYAPNYYTEEQAGRDFWFSRNGHGVGFWDRGLGPIGDELHSLTKSYGEANPYVGDDGQIYL